MIRKNSGGKDERRTLEERLAAAAPYIIVVNCAQLIIEIVRLFTGG